MIGELLKVVLDRKTRISYTIQEFAHHNKDMLIIVADPKTDKLFVGYGDKHVFAQIKSPEGKKMQVVKNILKKSQFKGTIDIFLAGLVETFQIPIWKRHFNLFLQFIDGSVYNISNALRGGARTEVKKVGLLEDKKDKSVVSPIQMTK